MSDSEPGATTESGGTARTDPPSGVDQRSLWPTLTALGVAGLYGGVALSLLAGSGVVPATGPWLPVAWSGVVLALGLGGWLAGGLGTGSGRGDSARRVARLATYSFLGAELATFGVVALYYVWIRANPWPPGPLPSAHPGTVFALTAALLTSSLSLHAARVARRCGDLARCRRRLGATLVLGALFVFGQVGEYRALLAGGYTLTSGPYATALFGLTGLHGLHVVVGLLALAVVLVRHREVGNHSSRSISLSAVTVYWHFVDAVWLALVAGLYAGARL